MLTPLTVPKPSGSSPHDPDAEHQVLAGILNRPPLAVDVLAVAPPEAFYVPRVRAAMTVVAALVAEGVPPEPATVATRAGEDGFTLPDLVALVIDAPTDGGTLHMAQRVAQHARERTAVAEAGELRLAAEQGRLEQALPAILDRLGGLAAVGPHVTSWEPVTLTVALDGGDLEMPCILARTDGRALIYPGRIHSFQGESESCKTWAALLAVVEVIVGGGDVLMIDFEDDEAGVTARLRALGLSAEQILAHLVYIRPDEPLYTRQGQPTEAAAAFQRVITSRPFVLSVIDGVTESMVTEGLELLSNSDIAAWMRRLPRPIAATGAAVIVVDHVVKNREAQGRYAVGGQHKLSGLTGAAYAFTTLRPFSRSVGAEPVEGTITITVAKDRPGYVRGWAADGKAGTLELTSWPDGAVTGAISPGTTHTMPDMAVLRRILDYLSIYDGASKNQIEKGIEGGAAKIRDALGWMLDQDWLRVEPKGRSYLHWLTPAGRAQLDTDNVA